MILGRAAGKAGQSALRATTRAASTADKPTETILKKGAKRDPELYVRIANKESTQFERLTKPTDPPNNHDRCLRSRWLAFRYNVPSIIHPPA